MATATSSAPAIYLAKQNGELVLRQGENPNQSKYADQRVLIVGGGVTGLTVSLNFDLFHSTTNNYHGTDRMGPSRRRLLGNRRV